MSQTAPAVAAPAVDRCAWNGRGENFCYAEMAVFFDGTECRGVCTARRPGEPGVFATMRECVETCLPGGD